MLAVDKNQNELRHDSAGRAHTCYVFPNEDRSILEILVFIDYQMNVNGYSSACRDFGLTQRFMSWVV